MRALVVVVSLAGIAGCSLPRGALGGIDGAPLVDAAIAIDAADVDAGPRADADVDAGPRADAGVDAAVDDAAMPSDVGTDTGPTCVPGPEACNLYDDDCDTRVDEAGCGCERRERDGHVYQLCPSATGFEAWGRCTTLGPGYDLIVLDDVAENDWLHDWTGFDWIAIGVNDFATEGTFVWADGRPDDLNLFGTGEPGGGANENCVFTANGKWFDVGCNVSARFVCEGPARTSPLPAGTAETCNGRDDDLDGPIDEDACGCPTRVFDHRLYQVCATGRTWTVAQMDCEDAGDYWLATVDTVGEAQAVGAMGGGVGWIGLNDEASETHFVWESDPSTPISHDAAGVGGHFVYWNGGEPNDAGGTHAENCVAASYDGHWNDWACSTPFSYVCERDIAP